MGEEVAARRGALALRLAPAFRFAALLRLAPRVAALFLIAGRLAADFFAADFFVEALRLAGRALLRELFFMLAARPLVARRLLAALPADFLRDFLARAAMTLLLGIGGDDNAV